MNSLVVFARAPVAGQTKTRLARAVGNNAAAEIAAAMLRDTLDGAQRWANEENEASVAFSPSDAFDDSPHSLRPFWNGRRFAQSEGDIGARMLAAIRFEQARGCERVALIGSDAPDLPASFLRGAFASLHTHDVVFGPAHDGGFTLVGASRALPGDFFRDVEWSCAATLEQTLDRARTLKFSVHLLEAWRDVDDLADLRALNERLLQGETAAPHTRRALSRLSLCGIS